MSSVAVGSVAVGSVAVVCGGVGAARLLRGFVGRVPADELTAIVNVADDMVLHGLHISPDLDTITYTLADAVSAERGWGLEGETWQAMTQLARYGGESWFNLGDKDLATHLYRTQRLGEGATLSEVTTEIAAAWELALTMVPVTDDPIRTMMATVDHGEISFQRYFVEHQHSIAVTGVRFDGADAARPSPTALAALESADHLVIAPSNPAVSIDPVLAVPGVRDILARRRDDVVAVSPIVGGKALKGPADRLLVELGREASALAVAEWYAEVVGTLIIDTADADLAPAIEALGVRAIVTDTIMANPGVTERLAELATTRA